MEPDHVLKDCTFGAVDKRLSKHNAHLSGVCNSRAVIMSSGHGSLAPSHPCSVFRLISARLL